MLGVVFCIPKGYEAAGQAPDGPSFE